MSNQSDFEDWWERIGFTGFPYEKGYAEQVWLAARKSMWRPEVEATPHKEYLVFSPSETVKVFTAEKGTSGIYGDWHRCNGGELTAHDSYFGDGNLGVTMFTEIPQP